MSATSAVNVPVNEPSAIGSLADTDERKILLPGFVVKRKEGICAVPGNMVAARDFRDFVEQVFTQGAMFRNLDYDRFVGLLYDPPERWGNSKTEVRFATDIVFFDPDRRQLYSHIQLEEGCAAYLFEPKFLETKVLKPVMGELPDGSQGVIRQEEVAESVRTQIDPDEFVAAMWGQFVRYGIDMAAVRKAIKDGHTEKIVIARPLPCKPGTDAEIRELTADLHRSDAPRELADGRVDFHQHQNRYPQVQPGKRLLKKIHRKMGIDGRNIAGDIIEPPIPADCDLESRAGPGTKIIPEEDGDYLVAAVGGFLNSEDPSEPLTVIDKIVNKEGVSARTTGNLSLNGDEYEVHGDIQEKCLVECHSIAVFADVYGDIQSHGGLISLKKNLSGGSAKNDKGDIVVEGLATGALLVALKGAITLKRAENCVVIGERVTIEQATRCDILADSSHIGTAEACAIAGKLVHLTKSRSRSDVDTVISMLVPDVSGYMKQIEDLRRQLAEAEPALMAQRAKAEELHGHVKGYLAISAKLKRKEIVLSGKQLDDFHKHAIMADPIIFTLGQVNEEISVLEKKVAELTQEIERLSGACQSAKSGVSCVIESIDGDTRVRSMTVKPGTPPLSSLQPKDLKLKLRAADPAAKDLFSDDRGTFTWELGVATLLD